MRRLFLGPSSDPRWARPALWSVLLVAFVLYAWALAGNANEYYSAAILSGTKSWKAFFFGALDAGSFITVDKPPFALWVMGLSARIFGYGTWSMLLPQALAGVAAVGVLYSAVRRSAGHVAALVAAVVMTLTPITVAINRDNNPDTVLVLLLVVAAWCCLEAIRRGRVRWLLACALFVGLGFNTKMLQAYLVVPAFVVAYLVCAQVPVFRRLGHVLAAGGVLLVSSAWWMVIVDLWPASSRPYIGGSSDNTVWDLVIGYNGLGRIFGQGGGGGGASFGGASGADRLFNDTMAGQISWLLPFCAITLVYAVIQWFRIRTTVAVVASHRRVDVAPGNGWGAAWLVWGGWLLVHFAVFSFSSGTFHPYYTTAMAPAVAAITGMGAVLMWRSTWVLPMAITATGAWSFIVLRRTPDFVPWLAWAVLGATAVAALALVLSRYGKLKIAAVAVVATLFAGLAGPAAYAVTPLQSQVNGTNPTAGPSTGGMGFGGMGRGGFPGGMRESGQQPPTDQPPTNNQPPTGMGTGEQPRTRGGPGGQVSASLIKYLEANQGSATWLVAVSSAQSASSIILQTGKPVIAMGGFTGSDPAMTVTRLKALIASGELRYVMAGESRGGPGGGNNEVTTWIQANCQAIEGQDTLYTCTP